MLLSLLLPWLGQFAQRRRRAGFGFLGATAATFVVLMMAERLAVPGVLPSATLLVIVAWSALDAWRHAFDAKGTNA